MAPTSPTSNGQHDRNLASEQNLPTAQQLCPHHAKNIPNNNISLNLQRAELEMAFAPLDQHGCEADICDVATTSPHGIVQSTVRENFISDQEQ